MEKDSLSHSTTPPNNVARLASDVFEFEEPTPIKKTKTCQESVQDSDTATSFGWAKMLLTDKTFNGASLSLLTHVPMSYMWEKMVSVGTKMEVPHSYSSSGKPIYWIASVIKIHGYFTLLRYEGFDNDSSHDFWINLAASNKTRFVGWCGDTEAMLKPPKSIAHKFADESKIPNFYLDVLIQSKSLPSYFHSKKIPTNHYKVGEEVEVLDKNQISRLRLATVRKNTGGRLHVQYFDIKGENGDFWCHEESPLVHQKGWAKLVGQDIHAPKDYNPPPYTLSSTERKRYVRTEEAFQQFQVGMKVEVVDPLNLSQICSGTVQKVLKLGFVMVGVDIYSNKLEFKNWFCYHISSPYLLPCGFCKENGIQLQPPYGYGKKFNWEDYLAKTGAKRAPVPDKTNNYHRFQVGMRLESADLMEPDLIYPVKITHIVGNLLKVNFDGWSEEFDYWLDSASPDIYPVGWCDLVGHPLECPPNFNTQDEERNTASTSSKKGHRKRKGRRGKKHLNIEETD